MPRLACRTPETHTDHSKGTHKQTQSEWTRCSAAAGLSVSSRYLSNVEAGLPEKEGQGLEKGLEVIVVIYCRLSI